MRAANEITKLGAEEFGTDALVRKGANDDSTQSSSVCRHLITRHNALFMEHDNLSCIYKQILKFIL
jgi:hypothetical protein